MVTEFRVTTDTISPFVKKFGKKAPIVIGEGLHKIALKAQTELRRSLSNKKIGTGKLWTQTIATKKSKKRSIVSIPGRGYMLDSMKPHYVALKRGRGITNWVNKYKPKGQRLRPNPYAKGPRMPQRIYRGPLGGLKGAIWVRPTPWIDRPLELTEKASIKIMNEQLNKVMV